jgi:hypothetical protein
VEDVPKHGLDPGDVLPDHRLAPVPRLEVRQAGEVVRVGVGVENIRDRETEFVDEPGHLVVGTVSGAPAARVEVRDRIDHDPGLGPIVIDDIGQGGCLVIEKMVNLHGFSPR